MRLRFDEGVWHPLEIRARFPSADSSRECTGFLFGKWCDAVQPALKLTPRGSPQRTEHRCSPLRRAPTPAVFQSEPQDSSGKRLRPHK